MLDITALNSVLVLPTYNEIENLDSFIRAVRQSCPSLHILIVDDDSPDGTGELAEHLAAELGALEVIHRVGERGLGSAYRAGFAHIFSKAFDAVITMDADFSHDPTVIPRFLSTLQSGADMVIGSRYVDDGHIHGWPRHRELLSRWGNAYTRWILRLDVRDCTSGFRAYRSDALQAINPSLEHGEGYVSLTALIRRAQQHHLRIIEIPITYTNRVRGSSKMSWRIILESMFLVTILGVRDSFGHLANKLRRAI
ncbi:MAG: polyprenol monophosphomannose synthase [Ilumatobacteraceae bacterium]